MYSHIMVGANDVQASKDFYDAILGALGYDPGVFDDKGRVFYFSESGVFSITTPIDGQPASPGNGSTIGFAARDPATADAWHAAGLANGGTTCEEPPGERAALLPNQPWHKVAGQTRGKFPHEPARPALIHVEVRRPLDLVQQV